jgi:hypothetical protein
MADRRDVDALIDRLVREARLPDARAREALRRELASHFDDVGDDPEALGDALARFGHGDAVALGLRRAHGRSAAVLRAARLVAAAVASLAVAATLVTLCSVRVSPAADVLQLGGGAAFGLVWSLLIAVAAVGAWELGVAPLCARLERRPVRALAAVATVAAVIYATHAAMHDTVGPAFALAGAGSSVAAWMASIAIAARLDLAFLARYGPPRA